METLSVDQSLYFPSGASFVAPKGWRASRSAGAWILEDPDRNLSMALMEIEDEDPVSAVREAWRLFRPDFTRDLTEVRPVPDKNNWDRVVYLLYEVGTSEKRRARASARGKGNIWYVDLLEGASAAVDRRIAQIRLVSGSFRAPGIVPETFAGKNAVRLDPTAWGAFAEFVEQARQSCAVPGAAVGVLQGGETVFEKGFGVRENGRTEPVTAETLFAVGSVTKPLTTLMMARLVDRGVFAWDTPVLKLKPDFQLGDNATTERLDMRHTVSASTGLPSHDMEFFYQSSNSTPEEAMSRMSTMRPTTEFGEVFQYSNSMVAAGGYIAAHASHPPLSLGAAYDLAMMEEVFIPLGMYDSTTDIRTSFGRSIASPHALNLYGEVKTLPLSMESSLLRPERPAGGVWSNLKDLEKVLWMELERGWVPSGERYLSEEQLLERRKHQVKMDDCSAYGLGLALEEDCGVSVVFHNGGTNGFVSQIFFLPDHKAGAVVMANIASAEACFFFEAVRRRLMELWFGGHLRAASDLVMELGEEAKRTMNEASKVEPRPEEAWWKSLVGTYQNPALGRIRIYGTKQGAVYEAAEWDSPLGRKVEKDGTVKAVLMAPPMTGFELWVGEKNGRKALRLEMPQQSYVLEAIGDTE